MKLRNDWKILLGVPCLAMVIGLLFAIIVPSVINSRDRLRYRTCLSVASSVKTATEILRTETDIASPKCVQGDDIYDCIAEEIIGMIGNKFAGAENLETIIGRSCELWDGGDWDIEAMINIIDSDTYEIKGRSARAHKPCNICVTEHGYFPSSDSECLSGIPVTCPHDKSQEMTQ